MHWNAKTNSSELSVKQTCCVPQAELSIPESAVIELGQQTLFLNTRKDFYDGCDLSIEIKSPTRSFPTPQLLCLDNEKHLELYTWDCEFSYGHDALTLREIIGKLLNLASDKSIEKIYINGGRTVSRSPALALALMSRNYGPSHNASILDILMDQLPNALPNRLILSIIDEILGRGGSLISEAFQHPKLCQRYHKRADHMEKTCTTCPHAQRFSKNQL